MLFAFPEFRMCAITIILFSVVTCSFVQMHLSVTWVQKVDLNAFSCQLNKNKCLASEFVGDSFSASIRCLNFLLSPLERATVFATEPCY